jgi:hypothetical protein
MARTLHRRDPRIRQMAGDIELDFRDPIAIRHGRVGGYQVG